MNLLITATYHFCDSEEHLLNINILLCASFEEWYVHLAGEPLCILCDHDFPRRAVILVSDCNQLHKHHLAYAISKMRSIYHGWPVFVFGPYT